MSTFAFFIEALINQILTEVNCTKVTMDFNYFL